jgi:hypothetical protein
VPVVIDDRLLFDFLAERPPLAIVGELTENGVFTTTYWYYRLGRAVVGGSGAGALSGPMERLDAESRQRVRSRLDAPPLEIRLLPPRVTVPVMFTLSVRRQPNLLAAEALAVALLVRGRLVVATESPLLRSGADDLGLEYEVVRELRP